jgi:putative transposase
MHATLTIFFMATAIPFIPERVYHIYNHATGPDNLFRSADNYYFFLRKHHQYLSESWELLCWCLMPNHFHLLIRLKPSKPGEPDEVFSKGVSKKYSHFMNSYVQACNKQWGRKGALMMQRFQRKEVTDELYLRQLVCYIHNNPVNHGFTKSPYDWSYSSYKKILFDKERYKEVIELFGDLENFKAVHRMKAGEELSD